MHSSVNTLKAIELYTFIDVFMVYGFYLNKDVLKKCIVDDSIYISIWKCKLIYGDRKHPRLLSKGKVESREKQEGVERL